jgi:hypothetical protein
MTSRSMVMTPAARADIIEYGIQWTGPGDVAGSVTILGTGLFNKDKGFYYLEMSARLPGKMQGKVVERTITWSDWRGVSDDGVAHLSRDPGFWKIHPGS